MKQSKSVKKYRALMLDVDGTLFPNTKEHNSPSVKIRESIDKASKILSIGIATGRPLGFVLDIIDDLRLSAPCIVTGGSQIYDPRKKKVIYERNIEKSSVKEIFKVINKFDLTLLDDGRVGMRDIKEHEVKHLTQFWIRASSDQTINAAVSDFSQISDISVHKIVSRYTLSESEIIISHAEATKQHGILKVSEILGIETHDIIGVGDGYNDFPLLMACGLKIAMGNAVPELKEIADYIAPSVEEDGVVDIIEKFILKNEKFN